MTASMRPPEFTGGNAVNQWQEDLAAEASMRPPEFTGGNVGGTTVPAGSLALQ